MKTINDSLFYLRLANENLNVFSRLSFMDHFVFLTLLFSIAQVMCESKLLGPPGVISVNGLLFHLSPYFLGVTFNFVKNKIVKY